MNAIFTVARKELRTWFQSPVALIFLGIFLVATVAGFFSIGKFFARNIADVRPLFEVFPVLLIFLVSAITMRQWAEEQRTGTLEVLLTLPLRTVDLVVGKFLAGLVLVALALAITLPIPVTVDLLGTLDWGPVVGGYVGALLLAAAYLSLGLCVSSRTDNQVVSLMVTLVLGGALYLAGQPEITGLLSDRTAEVLRALGTGSRFESIERGVIDLRDLVYYLGLTAFFLVLNGFFLERSRLDLGSEAGRARSRSLLAVVALVGLNAVALGAWTAPLSTLRVDLTRGGEYSISPVTRSTLATLDEPLTILGLFSERTHPLLSPLVPQIRDVLEEYRIAGRGRVRVVIADPNADTELEEEVNQQYNIKPVPFRVADRHQQSVVNSYFHLVVKYGDKHEILSFGDLIEVDAREDGADVRLRGLEYDLTRTIRKVTQEFGSVESLLARMPADVKLTAYLTPASLPKDLAALPDRVRKVGRELVDAGHGRLAFEEVDPTKESGLPQKIYTDYGVQPYALDLLNRNTFYCHLVLTMGERVERVFPRSDVSEADLRKDLEAAVRRLTPGQLKSVGLMTEKPEAPPKDPRMPPQAQPPAPEPDYKVLEKVLGADYDVKRLDLADGQVPDTVDVLVVGKPGRLSDKQRYAIDQFVMRGGSLVALAGGWRIDVSRQGLAAKAEDRGLANLLSTWGVDVANTLVMDPQDAAFPIPVKEKKGPFMMQRIELLPYPFFPDIRGDGLLAGHPALSGLSNVTLPWASPVAVATELPDRQAEVLLRSSTGAWLNTDGKIEPDFTKYPGKGFGPSGDVGQRDLGVALTGVFKSNFAEQPSPLEEEGSRTIVQSPPGTRLIVLGSQEITSDLMLSLAQQSSGEVHRANLQLLQNLVDWSVEDTELLTIRTSGAFARTLRPMEDGERTKWELGNYAIVLVALGVVALLPRTRRKNAVPLVAGAAKEVRS